MSDVNLANSPEIRTSTGEMIDQTPKPDTTSSQTTPETKEAETQTKSDSQPQKTEDQSKPVDAKSDEKAKSPLNEGKEEKKVEGAPEKYEAFKLPEGAQVNEESLKAATAVFKELGLSQDGAQKLVDLQTKLAQDAASEPVKLWEKQQTDWRKEVTEAKDLGPRLGEIKQNFSRMLDSVGDPAAATAFREMMEFTGAGNNPAFIRMMDKISSHFAEGKPLAGGKPAPVNEPGRANGIGANALYPNLK